MADKRTGDYEITFGDKKGIIKPIKEKEDMLPIIVACVIIIFLILPKDNAVVKFVKGVWHTIDNLF